MGVGGWVGHFGGFEKALHSSVASNSNRSNTKNLYETYAAKCHCNPSSLLNEFYNILLKTLKYYAHEYCDT